MAGIVASLRASVDALRERLRRTTMRERLLLAVLALGMCVYAPVAAMEWRSVQAERYIDAVTDRSTARLAANAARRIAAGAADQTALDDMNSWGFEAENPAIAQVLIERRLVETAAEAALVNPRITTNQEAEVIGPTQWIEAEVQTDLRWDPTFNFLDLVAEWPEGFRVTGFRYEITPHIGMVRPGEEPPLNGKVRLGLAFPVRIGPASSAPPQTTQAPTAPGAAS